MIRVGEMRCFSMVRYGEDPLSPPLLQSNLLRRKLSSQLLSEKLACALKHRDLCSLKCVWVS